MFFNLLNIQGEDSMKAKSLKMFIAAFISLFAFTTTMPVFAQTSDDEVKPQIAPIILPTNSCGVTVNNSPAGFGVKITQLASGEPCENAGLEVDDIIIAIETQPRQFEPVGTRRQLERALENTHGNVRFIVQDHRTGDIFLVRVRLP
jgi:predicted metalloprotease with PDZ domain